MILDGNPSHRDCIEERQTSMEPNRRPVSLLRLFVILLLASFICIGSVLLVADLKCHADIEGWWAPPYPNAETVSMEYDLFRPRALGETRWIMESPDDVETVKQFYRDKRLEVLNSERTRGLAWAESFVQPLEDGSSSRIILVSACGT